MTSSPDTHSFADNASTLSDRELQVIELVAAGLTNQDIAATLEISKRTVDNHVSNILKKTRTENRVALVLWALQWGKVCIDEVNCCILPKSTPVNPVNNNKPAVSQLPINSNPVPKSPSPDIQPLPLDTELCA